MWKDQLGCPLRFPEMKTKSGKKKRGRRIRSFRYIFLMSPATLDLPLLFCLQHFSPPCSVVTAFIAISLLCWCRPVSAGSGCSFLHVFASVFLFLFVYVWIIFHIYCKKQHGKLPWVQSWKLRKKAFLWSWAHLWWEKCFQVITGTTNKYCQKCSFHMFGFGAEVWGCGRTRDKTFHWPVEHWATSDWMFSN